MLPESVLEAFRTLTPEAKRWVAAEINAELAQSPFEVSDEVKRMLDERIAFMEANPNSGVPFEEVVRQVRARRAGG